MFSRLKCVAVEGKVQVIFLTLIRLGRVQIGPKLNSILGNPRILSPGTIQKKY